MFLKILNRFKRAPVPAIAVLLFATIISVIICSLQGSNDAELSQFEDMSAAIPIKLTVTDPTGTNSVEYFIVEDWVYYLFTGEKSVELFDTSAAENFHDAAYLIRMHRFDSVKLSLAEYVKDVQVKASRQIKMVGDKTFRAEAPFLCGITSISCDKQLLPENGCVITWNEGYDEAVFLGEEPVCIIPEGKVKDYDNGSGEVILVFIRKAEKTYECQCTLKIVGTYTGGDEKNIYCPYPIFEQVSIELDDNKYPTFDSLSATLADNSRLEEFREKASICFLEPSPYAERIRWGYFANNWYCEFYDYALDIDDENYQKLLEILEESLEVNRICTMIILVLSAAAGFLVGFLMIRSRKHDIMLMRTVGESNPRVYIGFVIEQMLCILLGVIAGGAYNMWKPIDKLLIFAVVYFAGLTLALAIFLGKKLLTTIKEDE